MTYEATTFDVDKLRRYARRVARELGGVPPTTQWVQDEIEVPVIRRRWGVFKTSTTETQMTRRQVTTPGSRWLLGLENSSTRTKLDHGGYGDEHYDVSYYLEHDGSLTTEVHEYYDGIHENRYFTGSDTTTSHAMTEQEMLYFDRQGNRLNGQLWAREKGVGLSARLTRLLKDRR